MFKDINILHQRLQRVKVEFQRERNLNLYFCSNFRDGQSEEEETDQDRKTLPKAIGPPPPHVGMLDAPPPRNLKHVVPKYRG